MLFTAIFRHRTGPSQRCSRPEGRAGRPHVPRRCGVLKAAWRLGLVDSESFHRAADIPAIRGETLPRGRCLEAGELRALFQTCASDASPAGRRDAALIAVAYGCGLRRSELVSLELADYQPENGELKILHGKGRKERSVYVAGGTQDALNSWISTRGHEPGPLFNPVVKSGKITIRHMSDQAVLSALAKRRKQAGVRNFSPHDMRRSFASDLLDAGGDIAVVQRLMGHSSPTVTARYDRRGERAKQRAAGLLFVPFAG